MTTTKQITNALGITYWVYDYIRECFFLEWCKKYSYEQRIQLYRMMTHAGLRNWYQDSWHESVEKKFIRDYGDFFGKSDKGTLERIMYEYAVNLADYYPQPLLNLIKDESKLNDHVPVQS
ncbi:MAG: hypothetical protein H3C36_03000 [Chitinophagaceae bacterium]|nr:hypothetical protein [Chitinophagaceae bacterium]